MDTCAKQPEKVIPIDLGIGSWWNIGQKFQVDRRFRVLKSFRGSSAGFLRGTPTRRFLFVAPRKFSNIEFYPSTRPCHEFARKRETRTVAKEFPNRSPVNVLLPARPRNELKNSRSFPSRNEFRGLKCSRLVFRSSGFAIQMESSALSFSNFA